ncbi:MAG TPA: hypothetical protein VFX96_19115, partial [Pyrinomonadaceae bacterium]|nr:hypothetical protein [Pyrinomonadaceae bacterium]
GSRRQPAMHTPTALALAQTSAQVFRTPSYFNEVFLLLFVAGAVAWLVAAVFGFGRAREFGPSVRWFALAAAFIVAYHLHFFFVAFGIAQRNNDLAFGVGAFLNLFILAAAVCAIVGFRKLNKSSDE